MAAAVAPFVLALLAAPLVVAAPPDVTINVDPDRSLAIGEAATFTANATDPDMGTIDAVDWDFGDGSPVAMGSPVTHSFSTPGPRTVSVSATDSGMETGSATRTVTVVNAQPSARFTISPNPALVGQVITFDASGSSDPDVAAGDDVLSYAWDLDNDGLFNDGTDATVTRKFDDPGNYTVRLKVSDRYGGVDATAHVVTVNPPPVVVPTAAFGSSPVFPVPGQPVTFTSSSRTSDPASGRRIISQAWDFDYDPMHDLFTAGDIDATGGSVTHSFARPGPHTVGLKVVESAGDGSTPAGSDVVSHTIVVNAPPDAAFDVSPGSPLTGDTVTFSSTSSDPDGPLTSQRWDLDGDGRFNDATGAVARRTFASAGTHTVRLKVTDDRGASSVSTRHIDIEARPLVPLRVIPNVTITIAGHTTARGARIKRLIVRAPEHAKVKVRCRGRDCPARKRVRHIKKHRLRFRRFERNLRAGTRVYVVVRKPGFVGRYVKFRVRGGSSPKRIDTCIQPGARRPSACPR